MACASMRCRIQTPPASRCRLVRRRARRTIRPGRSGFAHLFEHLMFKSTTQHAAGILDRLTRGCWRLQQRFHLGRLHQLPRNRSGQSSPNACCGPKPSAWDRWWSMRRTSIPKRPVVQGGVPAVQCSASPYGRLLLAVPGPGQFRPCIPMAGRALAPSPISTAATLDDVKAFHATYYRPDNAMPRRRRQLRPRRNSTPGWTSISRPSRVTCAPDPARHGSEPLVPRRSQLTTYPPNVPLPAVPSAAPATAATSPDIAGV